MVSQIYRLDGNGQWQPHKYGGSAATPANRDALVAGVHKPDANNTGPYTVTSWVDVFPTGGNNFITISASGTYYGRNYWGQIRVTAPHDTVFFRECCFMGPDPDSYGSGGAGIIQSFGTNPKRFEVWDSILDPMPWVTMQGRASLNPYSYGVHGGNVKMYRTEVLNVHDPWNWIGPNPSSTAQDLTDQSHIMQQCWFHKGFYANNQYPPNDGQPHCDGLQTNFGRNLLIKGSVIGGVRDWVGYNTWPGSTVTDNSLRLGHGSFDGAGYNSGDDFWNAGIMFKQEPDGGAGGGTYTDAGRIRNVTIEDNWIYGGVSGINHAGGGSELPNTFENTVVRNNRFGLRGADYGVKLTVPGGATFGTLPIDGTTSNSSGYYILRHSNWAAMYSGNTIEETGAAVPITNG